MSTCEAAVPAAATSRQAIWLVCGEPATAAWEYACVHEHVVQRATCDAHAPVPGQVGCKACWNAGHECAMAFRPVPAPP